MIIDEKSQTFSFKRMFVNSRTIFIYLLNKWLIIVIAGIIGSLAGISYAYFSKPTYTGELNFVLSDDNSQGGFSGLANQFGLDLSSGGSDVFSQDNVMVLMTSRKILSRALFRKLPGTKESLLNFYIRSEKMNIGWQKDLHLKNAYPFPSALNTLSPVQDSLFREIYDAIKTKNFDVEQPDKKVNVFNVKTTYYNELFACYLTKYLVEEASAFYIETKTSVARQNLEMLTHEADSLRARLGNNIVTAATAADLTFNLNPTYQVGRVPIQRSQADAAVTQAAYTEVIKNLEIAKITLAKAYPIYQIIDEPTLPLKMEKPGRLLNAIIFGSLAAWVVIIFYLLKFFIKQQDITII